MRGRSAIGWSAKSESIKRIASALNIGPDAIAFIDDQTFEREEVSFHLPEVNCFAPDAIPFLDRMPELRPDIISAESARRRLMYLEDNLRQIEEQNFKGEAREFLVTLNMQMSIFHARELDIKRAEELTLRTNQFNTTGYAYSLEELDFFRQSPVHRLYMVELADRFGKYGIIGLGLLECAHDVWIIKLLLMSCRVVSRGVGTVLINYLMQLAKDAGVRLKAEIIPNDRNRMMQIAYAFAGFREHECTGNLHLLENDLSVIQEVPTYVSLITDDLASTVEERQ